jgi:hypothetical protein
MPHAAVMLRPTPSYRPDAFEAGLARHGYCVSDKYKRTPEPDDILLLWNRTRGNDPIAQLYHRAGARVIIAENGYIGETPAGKPYALALDHHNGAGRWYVGDDARFVPEQKPWRESGDHILVMPQRGIGMRGIGMPLDWPKRIMAQLSQWTSRPIRMRRHPGAARPDPWPDLIGCHAVVTWGSGGAIKAIAHGIPVFHAMPGWIGGIAARGLVQDLESCFTPDREKLWRTISWAQWKSGDIESGLAFDRLLHAGSHNLYSASK